MKWYSMLTVLPAEHGGMTRASLRRSNALRDLGRDVSLLTFDVVEDLESRLAHVRDTSDLEGLPVRNMYTDIVGRGVELANSSADRSGHTLMEVPAELHSAHYCDIYEPVFSSNTQDFGLRNYVDSHGNLARVDYVDGSGVVRLVEERRSLTGGRRRFSVFNQDAANVVVQGDLSALRLAWINSLLGDETCVLLIDSPPLGRLLRRYRRSNVVKLLINHSPHVYVGDDARSGELTEDLVEPYRRASTFDSFVFLTESQRDDVTVRVDPGTFLEVIPNVIPRPNPISTPRDEATGIIVARLDEKQKRITLLIEALNVAVDVNPAIQFEVFGGPTQGADWDIISNRVSELGLWSHITFHGHVANAASEFGRGGFTVMSSSQEGQGMILVEAMHCGTIPIAFDVKYGPSDIIDDDETGFLVADLDVDSLGERIAQVSFCGSKIDQMRSNAQTAANAYRPEVIGGQYVKLIDKLLDRRSYRSLLVEIGSSLVDSRYNDDGSTDLVFELNGWQAAYQVCAFDVSLRAVQHSSLRYRVFEGTVRYCHDGAMRCEFRIPASGVSVLGNRGVVAWLRLEKGDTAVDARPKWLNSWRTVIKPSPTGFVDLR